MVQKGLEPNGKQTQGGGEVPERLTQKKTGTTIKFVDLVGKSPICQYGRVEDGLSLVACVDCESCEAVCKPFYQCTMSRMTVQMT